MAIYGKQNNKLSVKRILIIALLMTCAGMLAFYCIQYFTGKGNTAVVTDGAAVVVGQQGTSKNVNIVRARVAMKPGDIAQKINFELVAVPAELVPEGVVTSMDTLKDKRVRAVISAKEFIQEIDLVSSNAWYEEGDRLIEHTFQDGAIPASVDIGSMVDVKIFRQGLEDNIVVSKATVVNKADKTLTFYLNLKEQEYLKEAAGEGVLFLVKYLDETQPASSVTYSPTFGKVSKSSSTKDDSFAKSPDLN